MNKRDVMMSLLSESELPPYVPAGFFLHFASAHHTGSAAIAKHLDFFHATGMDFVKIQYEKSFPPIPEITRPEDWAKMPFYGHDFYAEQIEVVRGLVEAAKRDALIIVTLYSPFMCAGHTTSGAIIADHLNRDPDKVRPGLEIITESLRLFVRECMALGVDGFYHSTQGGEAGRFERKETFEHYIKPYDLVLMDEINRTCGFNILHVCDYAMDYDDFSPFLDYPGDVINCPLKLGDRHITPTDAAAMFKRPYMGGLERKGVLANGTPEPIRAEAQAVLDAAPQRFILGADCTVPSDTPWEHLKIAIDTAHARHPA